MAAIRRGADGRGFTPYLPRVALEWVERSPEQRWRVVDGSLAFVDVSGFTALSERLARRGPVGAEELTDVIDACFTDLLAVAYAEGGSLLKFGGDALLLLFVGDDHARRAATAALAMRATMRRAGRLATPVGNVRLRMSVGVHSGELHLFRVGVSHRELLITGPGATRTVEMEAVADAGEIVVSAATAAAIDGKLVGAPKGPGFLLRDRAMGSSTPVHAFPPTPLPPVDLSSAIPRALRPRLLAGNVESEHRHAAVAFVHFEDVDCLLDRKGPEAVATALDELATEVQHAADDYGVTFLATDIDRDGGKVILVAGAPQACDDGEGRMLAALRRIVDSATTLPVRIGVHHGRVFAGEIGPQYRRTYTVMGDAVNLAARLMAAAPPGQILATDDVLIRARGDYAAVALEPFTVKGKSRPVQAYAVGARVGRRIDRSTGRLPLVGREKAMASLLAALEAARAGRGQLADVTGDAGLGKSRLLTELAHHVGNGPMVTVAAEPYETTTPWYMVGQLLVDVLELEATSPRDLGAALRERVGDAGPQMLPWLPLLADVIGAEVPPTAEVSDLEPRFRRQRTGEVVVDLLDALFPQPTVFAFEDVQWADDASAGALRQLARGVAARPWLLIATRRESSDGFRAGDLATVAVALEPLDEDAAAMLVSAATADAPLRLHERDALVRRAGGNPLFLEELVRVHAATGEDEELPDSVEAVVATMIDRLAPADRTLLRYAAVLGFDFEPTVLAAIAGGDAPMSPATLRRRFHGLVGSDGRGRLRFRNRLVRDVAYETLPFRRRRELHGRAGDAIEAAAGENAEQRAEVLSLHFLHAERYDSCWHYARVGAARAHEKYANVEQAELLWRALTAARHLHDISSEDVAESWELQADAWQRAGVLTKAKESYRAARRLRAGQPARVARIYRREARIAEAEGRTTAAARWLGRGLDLLQAAATAEEMSERAEVEAAHAWMRQRRGRHREALRLGQRAVDTALTAANVSAAASAYVLLDWAHVELGQPDRAVHSIKALDIWEQDGALTEQAFALNAMGAFAYYRGAWDEAADLYGRALDAYRRAGSDAEAALARYNAAEILLDQGRLDEAEATLQEVVSVYRGVGYRAGLAMTGRDLGRIAARRGDFGVAEQLLTQSRETFAEYRAAAKVLELDAHLADLKLRRGCVDQALELIDAAIAQATASGTATITPLLQRLRGFACMARGMWDAADAALDASLLAARSADASYDVALTLEARSVWAKLSGRQADATGEQECLALLARLGVRSTPAPPLPAR